MSTTPFRQSMDARSFSAGQSFVSGVKLYWHNDLYPAVRNEYDKKVSLMADSFASWGGPQRQFALPLLLMV